MTHWYHVAPLFLLPDVLSAGGLRCGADLRQAGSPRRRSSRDDDDRPLEVLDGLSPADFVLLFTRSKPPLLAAKIRGRVRSGEPGKAYPHVRIEVDAAKCFEIAGWEVWGSSENVGRTIRRGGVPDLRIFKARTQVREAGVSEVMLPAASLPGRRLPLNVVTRITAFSEADLELVRAHLSWASLAVVTDAEPDQAYCLGQAGGRGRGFAKKTRELYEAIWTGDEAARCRITAELADLCFD